MTTSWLPAATLAAGVLGTLGGQALTGLLATRREESARIAEREVARDAFQRETLIDLQDALLAFVRSVSRLTLHHHRVFKETGQFGRHSDPDDLGEATRAANAAVARLSQRVLDDGIRQGVKDLQRFCVRLTAPFLEYHTESISDAERATQAEQDLLSLPHAAAALEGQIGEMLRKVL